MQFFSSYGLLSRKLKLLSIGRIASKVWSFNMINHLQNSSEKTASYKEKYEHLNAVWPA